MSHISPLKRGENVTGNRFYGMMLWHVGFLVCVSYNLPHLTSWFTYCLEKVRPFAHRSDVGGWQLFFVFLKLDDWKWGKETLYLNQIKRFQCICKMIWFSATELSHWWHRMNFSILWNCRRPYLQIMSWVLPHLKMFPSLYDDLSVTEWCQIRNHLEMKHSNIS